MKFKNTYEMPSWSARQLVPFDDKGNQLDYGGWFRHDIDWRDNEVFEDVLTYDHCERGRSAAHFIFTRKNGAEVTFFMADMHEAIPHLVGGKLTGKFTFKKRGANFGCALVKSSQ